MKLFSRCINALSLLFASLIIAGSSAQSKFPEGQRELLMIPSYAAFDSQTCDLCAPIYKMRINAVAVQFKNASSTFDVLQRMFPVRGQNDDDARRDEYLPPLKKDLQYDHFKYFFTNPLKNRSVTIWINQTGLTLLNVSVVVGSGILLNYTSAGVVNCLTANDGFLQLIAIVQTDILAGLTIPVSARLALDKAEYIHANTVSYVVSQFGMTLVADIDETLKLFGSNVISVIKSMFLRDYIPIPGATEQMHRFQVEAAASLVGQVYGPPLFYYLSAGPWQMAASITEFLISANMPLGPVEVTKFDLSPENIAELGTQLRFINTKSIKVDAMTDRLLVDSPNRTYILLGDSAMKDVEFESEMLARSERVKLAIIRKSPVVGWLKNRQSRFNANFGQFSSNRYYVFDGNMNMLSNISPREYMINDSSIPRN